MGLIDEDFKVIALVPMKGESERVVNKNMRNFNGKPLCYWIISKLVQVSMITKIVVNTDSNKIKYYLKSEFPELIIIDRPQSLIGHNISMEKIVENDINQFDNEFFIQTHVTNPLISVKTIKNIINLYKKIKSTHDSIFTVNRIQKRLYWQDGTPINHTNSETIRTQDLAPIFERNGNFYFFSKESFRKTKARIGVAPYFYEMKRLESVDIDTEEEFVMAELFFKHLHQ